MKLSNVIVHGVLFGKLFTTKPTSINKGVGEVNIFHMLLSTALVTKTLSTNCALLSLGSIFR